MATMDKQKENLERVTDFVEERQLDADRMAQVGGWMGELLEEGLDLEGIVVNGMGVLCVSFRGVGIVVYM